MDHESCATPDLGQQHIRVIFRAPRPVVHIAALADVVRDDWRALKPLVESLVRLDPA
jgi:hypothetical protein